MPLEPLDSPPVDDPDAPQLPPDPTFWRRYNPHLEFPTSMLIATLMMTTAFGVVVLIILLSVQRGPDRPVPPISLVDAGGEDESGQGSPGGGSPGEGDPLRPTTPDRIQEDPDLVPPPMDLPAARERLVERLIDLDPSFADTGIAPQNIIPRNELDEALFKKLIGGQGGKEGVGGQGPDGKGTGKGGDGADGTRQRSLRWVMDFQIINGRNYLDQLQSLGALVLVPDPGDSTRMFIFRDLANPKPGTVATNEELIQFSKLIQFVDRKRQSALEVGRALGLTTTPIEFWAIFPAGIEQQLAELERSYKNRRAEDIEQTRFQVTVSGGKFKLVVSAQTLRKR